MTLTLASLEIGQTAVITGFTPECRQEVRQRLLDLGFVRGSKIKNRKCESACRPDCLYHSSYPNCSAQE